MIWLGHMKTTVEIAEDLFARTREVARREGTTFRSLIEEGLRAALARHEEAIAPDYDWPDLSVGGDGLAPELGDGSWETVRSLIYSGHGA
jgi:hypothetical protein